MRQAPPTPVEMAPAPALLIKLPPVPAIFGVDATSATSVTALAVALLVEIALVSVRSPVWVRTSTSPAAVIPTVVLTVPILSAFESV